MEINEYQKLAMRTVNPNLNPKQQLVNAALGLTGEAGEFADLVKKIEFQGHKPDLEHLAKELGDICWYLALAASSLAIPLEEIFELNMYKVKKRYPDGFEASKSEHRKVGDV